MSRCILDNEKLGIEVVIGWDPPMGSFFARVANGEHEIFWTGNGDMIHESPEALVELIQPFACGHDKEELIRELWQDKSDDGDGRSYDLCIEIPDDKDFRHSPLAESEKRRLHTLAITAASVLHSLRPDAVLHPRSGRKDERSFSPSSRELEVLNKEITWQEKSGGEAVTDRVALLWTGEVLLNRAPGGMSSPFYAIKESAEAWAFQSALGLPAKDVCAAQLVSWHCAEPFAALVIERGNEEFKRLGRFWMSPIRSRKVIPVRLRGEEQI